MNTNQRIHTPAVASVFAGLLVAFAAVAGSAADRAPAPKADRFAAIGDTLCAAASGADVSGECPAWSKGDGAGGAGRFVTVASVDTQAGVTTLIRLRGVEGSY